MISKDFLNKLLSFARDTDKDIDAWKGVGIDIINSNIFSLCTKLEGYVLKEIFDEEFVDIWIAYVYPAGDTSYSKEDPFLYMPKEDSNEKIPVVWDDETFIDYMYEHLKE